jgi:osmoprotectant transport system ATP-binding protein
VGLDPDEDLSRYPGEFSGGQQQRIGVARAMAADQPLMLMDEPFGALDPITRDRLQDDFLRLHAEVPKTVVFVTHDIDEAIKMGHRIAILRDGELVQYDTPDHILAAPADDFVADFVGADRGLKRLVVWRLSDLQLDGTTEEADSGAPSAPESTSLRDALSLLLTEGSERLTVTGGDGKAKGSVNLETITRLIGPDEPAVRT